MNSVITGNFRPEFFPGQFNENSAQCLFRVRPFSTASSRRISPAKIRAFSTTFIETKPTEPVAEEKEGSGRASGLACPICYDPLTRISDSPLYEGETIGSKLHFNTCKKSYFGNQTHLDLVASSGSKQYDESMPLATELFSVFITRTPVVSIDTLRERLASKFHIWWLSSLSGMFTGLFTKSGLFSQVTALDFSENMLRQCYEFIEKEENFPKEYKFYL